MAEEYAALAGMGSIFKLVTLQLDKCKNTGVGMHFSIWSHCVEQVYLGYNHNKSQQY